MRQFKYTQLCSGSSEWDGIIKGIRDVRSQCLKGAAESFCQSMERTSSFAIMPAEVAFMVRRDQMWYDNAIFATTGRANITFGEFATRDCPPEVAAEVNKQIEEYAKLPEPLRGQYKAMFGIQMV